MGTDTNKKYPIFRPEVGNTAKVDAQKVGFECNATLTGDFFISNQDIATRVENSAEEEKERGDGDDEDDDQATSDLGRIRTQLEGVTKTVEGQIDILNAMIHSEVDSLNAMIAPKVDSLEEMFALVKSYET